MRAPGVCHAVLLRARNPVNWTLAAAFCALWSLVPWTLGLGLPPLHMALAPLHWSLAIVLVFPLPWQWTGDDRPMAPLGRGLAQAVPINLLWAMLILAGVGLVHRHPQGPHRRPEGPPFQTGAQASPRAIVGAATSAVAGLLLGWLVAQKERAEAGEDEARQAALQARMRVLQSQMSPHVLFNAMSGLAELVREDPEAAERSLLGFAALLRDLLDYSALGRVPLARERALVERYLALEQLRMGRRLRASWEWDAALEDREVPPLILQPLVENAIKHGLAPVRGGGELRIRLARGETGPRLEVANTGAPLPEPVAEGVGLANLRERLALARTGATLELLRDGAWTLARLNLREPS